MPSPPEGALQTVGMLFSPGYPGFLRGIAAVGSGEFVVTTSGGQVARYRPDWVRPTIWQPISTSSTASPSTATARSCSPSSAPDGVHSLRSGTVETLVSGLREPVGVTFDPEGAVLVAESGAGRVVRLASGGTDVVVDGLQRPQGIHVRDGLLYIVDAGAKELVEIDLNTKARSTIAAGLPVGAPPGVEPKPLKGMPPFSGPQGPFAGVTSGPDGTLYLSADGDGSVLAIART